MMPMRKRVLPYALAKTLFEIPFSFYEKKGIRILLLDLDNTLIPYTASSPDERFLTWLGGAKKAGLEVHICSNSAGKRVKKFASESLCSAECWMRKPFSGPLKKLIRENGWNKGEVILIGDQIMTDVKAANGAGIRCILTEPLSSKEPPWTRFNRLFDRPIRKKIVKKGLSKPWEDIL